ncbi:MAG: N-acyl homoserine lactonase family protein [Candidatus Rokuibacteriota bacterium]|nr:MAG: N-acyl homoserine lactonase family protein [Candidatus Rokubacteria bacterium]
MLRFVVCSRPGSFRRMKGCMLASDRAPPKEAPSPTMATGPIYEVYALKYGERDTTKCQFFYREGSHDKLTLHYFVWLILGGPYPVLVDTGFLEDDAHARHIRDYVSPATVVERIGVKPTDIPVSLISHLHYDHWAGHSLFPKAEFWIQKDEVAFWTGPFGSTPAFRGSANVNALAGLVTLNYANRVRIIEGEREVLPGLRVHRVGGHTAGLQIVTVSTAEGPVVLTSDASHFYHNVETRQPVQIITNLPEMVQAFETIHALAGATKLIVAGHDPQVAERFKQIEPGIVKIA